VRGAEVELAGCVIRCPHFRATKRDVLGWQREAGHVGAPRWPSSSRFPTARLEWRRRPIGRLIGGGRGRVARYHEQPSARPMMKSRTHSILSLAGKLSLASRAEECGRSSQLSPLTSHLAAAELKGGRCRERSLLPANPLALQT